MMEHWAEDDDGEQQYLLQPIYESMPAGPMPTPVVAPLSCLGSYFSPDHDAIMWSVSSSISRPGPRIQLTGFENLQHDDDIDDQEVRQWVAQVERKYALIDEDEQGGEEEEEDDMVLVRTPRTAARAGGRGRADYRPAEEEDDGGDAGYDSQGRRGPRSLLTAYQKAGAQVAQAGGRGGRRQQLPVPATAPSPLRPKQRTSVGHRPSTVPDKKAALSTAKAAARAVPSSRSAAKGPCPPQPPPRWSASKENHQPHHRQQHPPQHSQARRASAALPRQPPPPPPQPLVVKGQPRSSSSSSMAPADLECRALARRQPTSDVDGESRPRKRYHWATAASPPARAVLREGSGGGGGGGRELVLAIPTLRQAHPRGVSGAEEEGALALSCSEHEMLRLVLRLMRRHFRAWRDSVQAERAVKTETADLHYFKCLLERVLSSWRREVRRADEMALRAEAHSRTMLLRMAMVPWKAERRRAQAMNRQALAMAKLHVTMRTFHALRRHAECRRREKEQEAVAQHIKACRQEQDRARRHHHRVLQSRTFLAWCMALRLAKEESRLLRLHQDRKRRIESFVSGLVAQAAGDEQQLHNDDEQEEARSQRSSGSGGARVHHSAGGGGGRGARQQQPLHEVMDERAQERKARRDALKERYMILERERQEEERRRREAAEQSELEEAERIKQERRMLREAAKEREAERERLLQRQKEQLRASRLHYHRASLVFRGLLPWKQLMAQRQLNEDRALAFYGDVLLSRAVRGWRAAAEEARQERQRQHLRMVMAADGKYVQLLCRRVLRGLVKHHCRLRAKARAVQVRDCVNRLKSAMVSWRSSLEGQKLVNAGMVQQADELAAVLTKRRVLRRWQEALVQWREEKEVADRKALAWARVRGWLEDSSLATTTTGLGQSLNPWTEAVGLSEGQADVGGQGGGDAEGGGLLLPLPSTFYGRGGGRGAGDTLKSTMGWLTIEGQQEEEEEEEEEELEGTNTFQLPARGDGSSW